MMGNMELAEQLKAQLEKANKIKDTVTQISSKTTGAEETADQEEVILVRTDASGRVWPVTTPEPLESKAGSRKRHRVSTHEENKESDTFMMMII